MRMVVVLPEPLGPMKPYTSPRSSLIVSRFRAYRSPYILVRSRVSIMAFTFGAARGLACAAPGRGRRRLLGRPHREVDAHVRLLRHHAGEWRARLAVRG